MTKEEFAKKKPTVTEAVDPTYEIQFNVSKVGHKPKWVHQCEGGVNWRQILGHVRTRFPENTFRAVKITTVILEE